MTIQFLQNHSRQLQAPLAIPSIEFLSIIELLYYLLLLPASMSCNGVVTAVIFMSW